MGVVVKQSVQSMLFTIIGIALGALINIMSIKYFDKIDFGFTQNLIKVTLQISYVGLFGFNYALLIKGQQYHPDHPARSSFLYVAALVPLILTTITTLAYFLFKPYFISYYKGINQEMVSKYYILFPLFTIMIALFGWFEGYLQSINKSSIQSFSREILTRIIYIILIVLFAIQLINFNTFIYWYVILYAVPILYLIYHAKKTKGFTFKFKPRLFSKNEIVSLIKFSGYQSFVVLSFVLILQVDAILLGSLDQNGFELVAVYSMATFAISILRNPLRALANASVPTLSNNYLENNHQQLQYNFQKVSVSMQLASVVLSILMLVNMQNMVSFFDYIKPGYGAIQYLIPILLIGNIIDLFGGMNMEVISVTKYYRFNLLATCIMLVVIIILNNFLINKMGIYGAAWATTIGLSIYSIIKIAFLWIKLGVHPFNQQTLKICLLGGALYIINFALPTLQFFVLDIMVRSSILLIIACFAIYKMHITPEIDSVLQKFLKKIRLD